MSCPPAWAADTDIERGIRAAITSAFEKTVTKGKAPAVLRLAFHDAGTYDAASNTGGANASVVYELDRPESFGLKRGLRPVLDAKELLKGTPAEGVSLADLIQLAGAYAVKITGGPSIRVPLGRADSSTADPPGRMPSLDLSGAELRARFAAGGYSTRELVVLSGAHTIGGKGFGDAVKFDNVYFQTLLANPWGKASMTAEEKEMMSHIGIGTDKAMAADPECQPYIKEYAEDQAAFFKDFTSAYVKMGKQGVL